MKRANLALSALFLFVSLTLATQSQAASCLQLKSGVTSAILRALPRTDATRLGPFQPGAPLIAIIPRWYETRTTEGRVAFVSKLTTEIANCAAPEGGGGPQLKFELHAIDVGTGLAI